MHEKNFRNCFILPFLKCADNPLSPHGKLICENLLSTIKQQACYLIWIIINYLDSVIFMRIVWDDHCLIHFFLSNNMIIIIEPYFIFHARDRDCKCCLCYYLPMSSLPFRFVMIHILFFCCYQGQIFRCSE